MELAKPRSISTNIQSPRTRLLYLIYSAPNSRIKAEPGVKSTLASTLGYKSDGHFHYDWNYLIGAGLIEENQGYFRVTEAGKKEFSLHESAYRSNITMLTLGIAIIIFTISQELGVLPKESVIFFGITLTIIGLLFLSISQKNKPKLPKNTKETIKQLS